MIDLVFPLALDGSGAFASTQDPKQVWRGRVLNLLSTLRGDRAMRPEFGTASADLAFENASDIRAMAQAVVSAALEQLPEVRLVSVTTTTASTWLVDGVSVHVVYESPDGPDDILVPLTADAISQLRGDYVSFDNLVIGGI